MCVCFVHGGAKPGGTDEVRLYNVIIRRIIACTQTVAVVRTILTGIDVLLHLQMFKRGGIDEVCSLLVLVAQEQADQQANQPTTDGPDQATTDAELQSQRVDNNVDTDKNLGEGTFALCVCQGPDTGLYRQCTMQIHQQKAVHGVAIQHFPTSFESSTHAVHETIHCQKEAT